MSRSARRSSLRFRATACFALLSGLGSVVSAQAIPELYARYRGSGTYEIRGSSDSWRLSEAFVRVGGADRVEIEIGGRDVDLKMSGRATGWASRQQIGVQLEQFDGQPTNVKGWVRLDQRGGFERIELDGQSPQRIGISFFSSGLNLESAPPPPIDPFPPYSGFRMTEEQGSDRRGRDYTDFRAEDLRECQSACLNDRRCQAYSFSRPDSRCWLKDAALGANSSRDHVSGVKEAVAGGIGGIDGGQPSRFEVREGFDQLGNDFARVAASDAEVCQARCEQNSRCRAFTYVRRESLCYLKDRTNVMRPASGKATGVRRD